MKLYLLRTNVLIHPYILRHNLLISITADEADRSKRSVLPVTTTEQRIRFKEVQLKPKLPESSSDPFIHESPGPPTNSNSNPKKTVAVDRITGKFIPPTRAPKGRGKKKGKQKAAATEKEPEARPDDIVVGEEDITMTERTQGAASDQGEPMDEGGG